jgi:hypothetical protein
LHDYWKRMEGSHSFKYSENEDFFFLILGFELWASCLLGRCSTILPALKMKNLKRLETSYDVSEISSWDTGHWAGSNVLLCWHRPSGLVSKGWVPRTKRFHLIYPCKQLTEAKSKAYHTYGCMWLHWLFHFPSAMWPSCFNSLSFISALPSFSPCNIIRTQAYLFLFWSSSLLQWQSEKNSILMVKQFRH